MSVFWLRQVKLDAYGWLPFSAWSSFHPGKCLGPHLWQNWTQAGPSVLWLLILLLLWQHFPQVRSVPALLPRPPTTSHLRPLPWPSEQLRAPLTPFLPPLAPWRIQETPQTLMQPPEMPWRLFELYVLLWTLDPFHRSPWPSVSIAAALLATRRGERARHGRMPAAAGGASGCPSPPLPLLLMGMGWPRGRRIQYKTSEIGGDYRKFGNKPSFLFSHFSE